jgi:ABC-type sugar transport system ATPase subunit
VGKLEQKIDPDELVSDLRIGQQQIVEIAKALAQDVRILIMDEPTSALSAAEVEVLFRVIRELKSRGVAIIYISHKLEELLQIGDYITVLRDGRKVAEEASKSECSLDDRENGRAQPGGACSPQGTRARRCASQGGKPDPAAFRRRICA